MAVGLVHVGVLKLRGRRQQDVGIVGCVSAEVLQHHREQVLARKAGGDLAGFRRHRDRVAVVDHHGLDARRAGRRLGQQRVADGAHVDDARQRLRPARQQVGALQRGFVDREEARGRQLQPARGLAPGAHQRRQARHRAHRLAAAVHALHAVVQADCHRLALAHRQLAVEAGQPFDVLGRDAADLGRACRGVGLRALAQRIEADGVAFNVVVVEQVVADQHMDQRQRQRAVGAGHRGDMAMALLGAQRAVRVDCHQRGAAPLGFLRAGPEMQVGGNRVAPPDDHQPGIDHVLHVHAHAGAVGVAQRGGAGAGADGAVQPRRAQLVEEARGHALALHQPHGAGVAVRHDRLRIARGDRLQAGGDGVQRLLPGDRRELAFALPADALHRRQQPVRVVGALGVARHLGAQHALRAGMVGIARYLDGTAVLDGDEQGTSVGAVMRTGGADDAGSHGVSGRGVLFSFVRTELEMPAQAAGCGARAAPAGGAFPAVRGDGGEYLDPIVFDYDVPARCRHRPVRAPCRTT
ncbi:hypothetical protein D9M72_333130 [compost metagenome]